MVSRNMVRSEWVGRDGVYSGLMRHGIRVVCSTSFVRATMFGVNQRGVNQCGVNGNLV
jgi:hypothetical protein